MRAQPYTKSYQKLRDAARVEKQSSTRINWLSSLLFRESALKIGIQVTL